MTMRRNLQTPILTLAAVVSIMFSFPLHSGKLYRWVDEEGKVHYTDRVPPDQVDRARTQLDARGLKIESVRAARTPEEIAREKELERLRAEKQRLIEEQKAADRVLLKTFRSEDDIEMTLNGKLAAIDVQIQVVRGNIKRLKEKLANMQKDAAELELQGKNISKRFLKEIENSRQALKDSYAAIIRAEERKEHYRLAYKKDLERFRTLKHLKSDTDRLKLASGKNLILDHLYTCSDQLTCDQAWITAENFVREFSTTKIQMLSDTIIMTAPPSRDQDISITIARIRQKPTKNDTSPSTGAQLFMDLQCKNSPLGDELCAGEKVEKIRYEFKAYMAKQDVMKAGRQNRRQGQTLNNPASNTPH